MLRRALPLLLLLVAALARAGELLLVVGDVSDTSARVLYEALGAPERLQVSLALADGPVVRRAGLVTAGGRPQVLPLRGLEPNTAYRVDFGREQGSAVDSVTFSTFAPAGDPGSQPQTRILVASCNRLFEDGDDGLLRLLGEREGDRLGLVHLGDQVYADAVAAGGPYESAAAIEEAFRDVYRRTWSAPAVARLLRHGAHWMLPDDHDVVSNFGRRHVGDLVAQAGLRVAEEYQLALRDDAPEWTSQFWARRVGGAQLVMLDLRFDRALRTPHNPSRIVSPEQERAALEALAAPRPGDAVVLSNGPLAYFTPAMAAVAHAAEQEEYSSFAPIAAHSSALLRDLLHPQHNVSLLLSGEMHQAADYPVCLQPSGRCTRAVVTSGLTRGSTAAGSPKLLSFFMLNALNPARGVGNGVSLGAPTFAWGRNYVALDIGESGVVQSTLVVYPRSVGLAVVEDVCNFLVWAFWPLVVLGVGWGMSAGYRR